MDKLPKQIIAEKEYVEMALNNLKTALARGEKTIIELAAIATFLHNIYNGIENILKQILLIKNIQIPRSDTWHKDLLNCALSTGVISEGLSDELYKYLTFRHFFIHSYGFMLEEKQLEGLAQNVYGTWSKFLLEIETFLKR